MLWTDALGMVIYSLPPTDPLNTTHSDDESAEQSAANSDQSSDQSSELRREMVSGFKRLNGGLEHQVFFLKPTGRVFKITKPPHFAPHMGIEGLRSEFEPDDERSDDSSRAVQPIEDDESGFQPLVFGR